MRFLKTIYTSLIILCLSMSLFAQTQIDKQKDRDITPMHEFMKANMDSTIIYQSYSNWLHTPEYFMISKKGDTLTAYKYQSLYGYDNRIIVPNMMASKLDRRMAANIFSIPVDINQYFNPIYINPDSIKKFWNNLIRLNPWQIKDDSIEGEGCPVIKGKDSPIIYDGGGITLFLVTKNEIKKLYFYAPRYFEKECKGRESREKILNIQQYFLSHFRHVKW